MGILSISEDISSSNRCCKISTTSRLLILYGFSLLLVTDTVLHVTAVTDNSPVIQENADGICKKGVDIRNALAEFKGLKGCRVVEGFVQILLFDSETEFSNISFPELTEITDYLLMYRVNGLRSIGQLFPNLAVIRGQNLFYGYALVIFEMSSLQEIGLYSLTNITEGLIRIDKNPSLCFVNSIDWDQIATEKREHFIKSMKPENECPLCAEEETFIDNATGILIKNKCPKPVRNSNDLSTNRYLCWNKKHCQRICPKNCHTCNQKGECCSKKCLGGCAVDDINNCTVCNNFRVNNGANETCEDHCRDIDSYEYLGRRCVSANVCRQTKRRISVRPTSEEDSYKIFNKSCVLECPANYMSDESQVCVKCNGTCSKTCPSMNVDNISLVKQLRGCTRIEGDLQIQIRGGKNIVSELEENLGMIEVITGYLKIVRSFPLESLSFFKKLRVIEGKHLESHRYVFVVLDNQNLQDFWDWKNRTFKILNGKLFFHFNPKLCLNKIVTLQEKAGMANFTDLEVASNSNGDKVACDIHNLTVTYRHHDHGITLSWEQFKLDDQRKLLGYTVYSKEAPERDVTLFDNKDACSEDEWRVDDATYSEDLTNITHPLANLKAYTQYAFYVQTYTIATERMGARSDILYFRTSPSTPSPPQNLRVTSISSSELEIKWDKPASPNGNVTHYMVCGKRQVAVLMDVRDFCENQSEMGVLATHYSTRANVTNTTDTCQCGEQKKMKKRINEGEQQSRIDFENALHNEVYYKRTSILRKRRQINIFPNNTRGKQPSYNSTECQMKAENGTNLWDQFNHTVYLNMTYRIGNLHHYSAYEITVRACREIENEEGEDVDNSIDARCSVKTPKTEYTQVKENADDIGAVRLKNQTLDTVTITWDEPARPNGVIFAYHIEYRQWDNENPKATLITCITRKAFLNQNKLYQIKLSPGNYSIRVRAFTSAKNARYSPRFSPSLTIVIRAPQRLSVILGVLLTILFIVIIVIAVLYYFKMQRDKRNMRLIPSVNPEYVHTAYVADEWEIPRENIQYNAEDALGQGSFGMVYEGVAHDIRGQAEVKCAIKTVNEHATDRERIEFLNEASVMKAFDTSHVVRLLGVVSKGQPTLVIMELMANGDLKSYLRSHRPDSENPSPRQPPTLKQILQMAVEIADGMAYLAAKKFVHRDLAARNCMVSEDLTVKIGDFGMTRDIYETDYYRKGTKGLLPVRWMAPESLQDGVFTSNSDVWSYGVVLWEMATLGSQPYQGLSNDQVLRYVIAGGLMERPENCPDILYNLMKWCWQHKPSHRPTFLKLCSELAPDANSTFAQVSFYHSPAGIEAQHFRPTPSPSQDDANTPLRADSEVNSSFSNSDDDSDVDLQINSRRHRKFRPKGGLGTTANGFVGYPTNGAATTQC